MRTLWITGAALAFGIGFGAAGIHAQQKSPAPPAAAKAPAGDALDLSATSVNVASPGIPVKIRITRWSTDAERTAIIAALTAPPAREGRPGGAGAGRGGAGRGARGDGANGAPAGGAAAQPQTGRAAAGRAGANAGAAGGGGRAARGGGAAAGRGRGALVQRAPLTPVQRLADALDKATTVGYIWTNDVTGYSIRYAWHAPANGGERIVLVTDRRLDMYAPEWKPSSGTEPADYEFTLLEMRLDARGAGVAKTSLTTKVTVDKDANTLALEDFAGTPPVLQNVKHYQPRGTE